MTYESDADLESPVLVRDGNGRFVEAPDQPLNEWMKQHHFEIRSGTLDKADEYGSLDLRIMGANMAHLWPALGGDSSTSVQMQAAIAFYLLGKCSRVLSALAEGKPPPTDSWKDAEVYSMMGLYVQEHGQWP